AIGGQYALVADIDIGRAGGEPDGVHRNRTGVNAGAGTRSQGDVLTRTPARGIAATARGITGVGAEDAASDGGPVRAIPSRPRAQDAAAVARGCGKGGGSRGRGREVQAAAVIGPGNRAQVQGDRAPGAGRGGNAVRAGPDKRAIEGL